MELNTILEVVCAATGISEPEMRSATRKREIVLARQLYCYAARATGGHTMAAIGVPICRHHTSVLASIYRAKDMVCTDGYVRKKAHEIGNQLTVRGSTGFLYAVCALVDQYDNERKPKFR